MKLIVKISEGSVRDALSLLDRALLTLDKDEELNFNKAQEIFGYFDKSQLINILNLILQAEEKKVIDILKEYSLEREIKVLDFAKYKVGEGI